MTTMTEFIFDKTDRGREEIATRKFGLASRMRQLLVMIDGKKSQNDLLAKVSGLGLDDKSIAELIDNNFIEQVNATPPTVEPDLHPTASAVGGSSVGADTALTVDSGPTDIERTPLTNYERIGNVKHFFNETIKSVIGLRGFSLQLKVEKAGTIEELHALREAYFQAALKAKGHETAASLLGRLDSLLNDEV